MTITLVTLLKRRPGMSKADFIAYYEEHHRRIGERVLGGYATRYVRRFLLPVDGEDQEHDADVVMEIDFPDEATRDACFAAMANPEVMAEIVADEERLFDRPRIRGFTIEERQSELPPLAR
ncbi:MAG: EthD domain-containing protein [Novosphingobium sp.]